MTQSLIQSFCSLFATLANQALAQHSEATQYFNLLENRVLSIQCSSFKKTIQFIIRNHALELHTGDLFPSDAVLYGTGIQLLSGLFYPNKHSLISKKKLHSEGNMEYMQQFYELLSLIEWETVLSILIGDLPTHYFQCCTQQIMAWIHEAKSSITQDMHEYSQEEGQWLPSAAALKDFFTDVDELRLATDRAHSKIIQLRAEQQSCSRE